MKHNSASDPISEVFNETTAIHVSEIQCHTPDTSQSRNPHIIRQPATQIKPVMVRSNHAIFVVSLDTICLQKLMKSTFSILQCPVPVQVSSEVCFLRLQPTETPSTNLAVTGRVTESHSTHNTSFWQQVFPANHLAMVLTNQTYNTYDKDKKPKQPNLTKQNYPSFSRKYFANSTCN